MCCRSVRHRAHGTVVNRDTAVDRDSTANASAGSKPDTAVAVCAADRSRRQRGRDVVGQGGRHERNIDVDDATTDGNGDDARHRGPGDTWFAAARDDSHGATAHANTAKRHGSRDNCTRRRSATVSSTGGDDAGNRGQRHSNAMRARIRSRRANEATRDGRRRVAETAESESAGEANSSADVRDRGTAAAVAATLGVRRCADRGEGRCRRGSGSREGVRRPAVAW